MSQGPLSGWEGSPAAGRYKSLIFTEKAEVGDTRARDLCSSGRGRDSKDDLRGEARKQHTRHRDHSSASAWGTQLSEAPESCVSAVVPITRNTGQGKHCLPK